MILWLIIFFSAIQLANTTSALKVAECFFVIYAQQLSFSIADGSSAPKAILSEAVRVE
jgi:hypothetical protein